MLEVKGPAEVAVEVRFKCSEASEHFQEHLDRPGSDSTRHRDREAVHLDPEPAGPRTSRTRTSRTQNPPGRRNFLPPVLLQIPAAPTKLLPGRFRTRPDRSEPSVRVRFCPQTHSCSDPELSGPNRAGFQVSPPVITAEGGAKA